MIGSTALALWMFGVNISGQLTATTGTEPSALLCENMDFAITDTNWMMDNTTCAYNNDDGNIEIQFTCDLSGISSTDENCNYEEWDDFDIEIAKNGVDIDFEDCSTNPTISLVNGVSMIAVRVRGNSARCPLDGTYSISGSIV